MLDPSRPLQDAIIAYLKADAAVRELVGDRIYDAAPKGAEFPHASMGGVQVLPDKGDAVDGAEAFFTIDAWSQNAKGFGEVMNVARVIAAALDDAELVLAGGVRLVDLTAESIHTLRDPDGITRHAVINFKALTEPT
ncbi:MAG: DUF3168 domain-containing protein [Alphaproteobacteria bacterium]|nr:MAG: DUF3168 domain-containing protein [Alphaproteobacteria bacterium]